MKVSNMQSSRGNDVPNQFLITGRVNQVLPFPDRAKYCNVEVFQSYQSTIARKIYAPDGVRVELDIASWDYSATTGKYRNQFLGEGIAETRRKIESGEYTLVDLNRG